MNDVPLVILKKYFLNKGIKQVMKEIYKHSSKNYTTIDMTDFKGFLEIEKEINPSLLKNL